jgi:hypothetical protein
MFLCRCIETMHTNPSYPGIPYLTMLPENSSCFGLLFDRGWRCHCHDVFSKVEVGSVVVCIALVINNRKKTLRKKIHLAKNIFVLLSNISLSACSDIPSTVCYEWIVQLWHLLFNKLVSVTPQTNNTWRKLRASAFQWLEGVCVCWLPVTDEVL